jgi:hypothetical protein
VSYCKSEIGDYFDIKKKSIKKEIYFVNVTFQGRIKIGCFGNNDNVLCDVISALSNDKKRPLSPSRNEPLPIWPIVSNPKERY